jgi:hypothetical protein
VNAGSHRGHVRLSSGLRRGCAPLRFDMRDADRSLRGADDSILVGMRGPVENRREKRSQATCHAPNRQQIKFQATFVVAAPVGIARNFVYRLRLRRFSA